MNMHTELGNTFQEFGLKMLMVTYLYSLQMSRIEFPLESMYYVIIGLEISIKEKLTTSREYNVWRELHWKKLTVVVTGKLLLKMEDLKS